MAHSSFEEGDVIDGYRITHVIAKKGMGQVFRVEDTAPHRRGPTNITELVLKTVRFSDDPTDAQQMSDLFEREVDVHKTLSRKTNRVVQLTHYNVHCETPYFVMEFLPGWDLSEFVKHKGGFLDRSQAWSILKQVCEGIAAAHNHPTAIIHRDIKPSNVRILTDESVKLLDFGLAKFRETTKRDQATAKDYHTSCWAAPEHARKEKASPSMDIWALGLLAFYVLTGHEYFDEDLYNSVVKDGRKGLPGAKERATKAFKCGDRIPPRFDLWFARCLDFARFFGIRVKGYARIEDAQNGLQKVLLGPHRTWSQVGAAAAAVAAVAAGIVILIVRQQSPQTPISPEQTPTNGNAMLPTGQPQTQPSAASAPPTGVAPPATTATTTSGPPTDTTAPAMTATSAATGQPSAKAGATVTATTPGSSKPASMPTTKPTSSPTSKITKDTTNF